MKNLTPITRKEMFMAKAAGQDVTPPEPITREEMFLSDIAEHEEGQGSGGGGSSGGGIGFVTLNNDYSLHASYNDLKDMVDNGTLPCIIDASTQNNIQIAMCVRLSNAVGVYTANFSTVTVEGSTVTQRLWQYEASDPTIDMPEKS